MRDVTLVILNSLRIKCHIRRPLSWKAAAVKLLPSAKMLCSKYTVMFLLAGPVVVMRCVWRVLAAPCRVLAAPGRVLAAPWGVLAAPWRACVGRLKHHRHLVILYLVTALLALPALCHHLPHSLFYWRHADLASRQLADRQANTLRVSAAEQFLASGEWRASARDAATAPLDIVIAVVSVQRRNADLYRPQYLTQTVAGLLRALQATPLRVLITVCNVDADPASHTQANRLSAFVPVHQRFSARHSGLEHRLEKEKADYLFCLNNTLHRYSPRYTLLVEDDALPRLPLFPVIAHVLHDHIDGGYQRGEFVWKSPDPNLAYVKLFHPDRLVGYYSIEPERLPGLAAIAAVVGTTMLFAYRYKELALCCHTQPPYDLRVLPRFSKWQGVNISVLRSTIKKALTSNNSLFPFLSTFS